MSAFRSFIRLNFSSYPNRNFPPLNLEKKKYAKKRTENDGLLFKFCKVYHWNWMWHAKKVKYIFLFVTFSFVWMLNLKKKIYVFSGFLISFYGCVALFVYCSKWFSACRTLTIRFEEKELNQRLEKWATLLCNSRHFSCYFGCSACTVAVILSTWNIRVWHEIVRCEGFLCNALCIYINVSDISKTQCNRKCKRQFNLDLSYDRKKCLYLCLCLYVCVCFSIYFFCCCCWNVYKIGREFIFFECSGIVVPDIYLIPMR